MPPVNTWTPAHIAPLHAKAAHNSKPLAGKREAINSAMRILNFQTPVSIFQAPPAISASSHALRQRIPNSRTHISASRLEGRCWHLVSAQVACLLREGGFHRLHNSESYDSFVAGRDDGKNGSCTMPQTLNPAWSIRWKKGLNKKNPKIPQPWKLYPERATQPCVFLSFEEVSGPVGGALI